MESWAIKVKKPSSRIHGSLISRNRSSGPKQKRKYNQQFAYEKAVVC